MSNKVAPIERWVVVGDTQVPFHDARAVEMATQIIGYTKPDHIIYNGDIADFWTISRHSKSRSEILKMCSFQEEIDKTIEIQDKLSSKAKKAKRHMIDGNHEERLNAFLGNGPQIVLGSLRGLSIPEVFNYEARGFSSYRPYGEGIWITNNLFCYHGTYVDSNAGGSVRKEIESIGASVIMGHVHRRADVRYRQGLHEWRGIENGCLCQFNPSYKFHTNWAHCLTIVDVYDKNHWRAEVVDFIHDNEQGVIYCIYNGTKFEVPLDYQDGISLEWTPDRVLTYGVN